MPSQWFLMFAIFLGQLVALGLLVIWERQKPKVEGPPPALRPSTRRRAVRQSYDNRPNRAYDNNQPQNRPRG
jgi:hypothetical protein